MSTPDIKNAGIPVTSSVNAGLPAQATTETVKATVTEPTPTGIYNVKAGEGRSNLQKVMLDLGLTMPEFLSGTESRFISNMSPQAKGQLTNIASSAAGLTAAGGSSAAGTADLQGRWADFVAEQGVTGTMDVNALVQWVLREAYMENTKDLQFYAEKVRFYNDLKKQIRDELSEARKYMSSVIDAAAAWVKEDPDNRKPEQFPVDYTGKEFYDQPNYDPEKGMVPKDPATVSDIGNKGELETYIKNMEEKLNSVGDDAQLANVDLQNMLQKQQQTLQMMSNISKMLNDTAMAIIRKIGG